MSQTCVKVSDAKLTFEGAKQACQAEGARLAEPRNAHDNEIITSMIGKESVFFGAADNSFGDGTEGKFVWLSDKAPVTWGDWFKDQPNNYDNQHCMAYLEKLWNDDFCHAKHKFICQKGKHRNMYKRII